ncbi:peptide deformylase [Rhodococcus sp. BP-241]|uniref:peptide deformylase n=1 Tax=Rhodococcus sp. BP-241 TaxID=2739441 RepID=UPI0027DFAEE9|nr:peptide deformylase [Rhodococcus sp. BP-241]
MCNPVVEMPESSSRRLVDVGEGCLSLPGAYTDLARPEYATCRGQDQYGDPIELTAGCTLGRCFQHESDHIDRTVFGDRLLRRRRKQLYRDHEPVSDRYGADRPAE